MCYSALVEADIRELERRWNAKIDRASFVRVFRQRDEYKHLRIKIPREVEDNFKSPTDDTEREIHDLIVKHRTDQATAWEQEIFKQKKRLADAERSLAVKETKKAREDVRIATSKIETLVDRLRDLRRTDRGFDDGRIYPMTYAPIVIEEAGQRWVRLMRYTCRLQGKPANYDVRYPGTYNARRDSLGGFWSGAYGANHGIIVVKSFYENVARHDFEHRELQPGEKPSNVVLQFKPQPPVDMVIACLWSHWTGKDEPELDSFAAITDEPPPEIAAAGHNRCIISLTDENVGEWLKPQSLAPERLAALLDEHPAKVIYEHQEAA